MFCDKTHNSISGTAKDINIQNVNNTDTHYSKHKKVKVSLADVLGTIAKNPLLLKNELTAVFLILPSKSSVEV
jgi:hypothetical protein